MSDQRFNTGNPIGSDSPLDRSDNTRNLDELVNSNNKLRQPDRFGNPRKTWHGMEVAFDVAQQWREENFNAMQSGELTNRAESAADRAEAASDAAFVNADVYPDIASGLAAVADDEQFQVVEGNEIVRYRKDSGTSFTPVARVKSSIGVDLLVYDILKEYTSAALTSPGTLGGLDPANFVSTDFIPVPPLSIIRLKTQARSAYDAYAFYTYNKSLLASGERVSGPLDVTLEVPKGAFYMRVTSLTPSNPNYVEREFKISALREKSKSPAFEKTLDYGEFSRAAASGLPTLPGRAGYHYLFLPVLPGQVIEYGNFSGSLGSVAFTPIVAYDENYAVLKEYTGVSGSAVMPEAAAYVLAQSRNVDSPDFGDDAREGFYLKRTFIDQLLRSKEIEILSENVQVLQADVGKLKNPTRVLGLDDFNASGAPSGFVRTPRVDVKNWGKLYIKGVYNGVPAIVRGFDKDGVQTILLNGVSGARSYIFSGIINLEDQIESIEVTLMGPESPGYLKYASPLLVLGDDEASIASKLSEVLPHGDNTVFPNKGLHMWSASKQYDTAYVFTYPGLEFEYAVSPSTAPAMRIELDKENEGVEYNRLSVKADSFGLWALSTYNSTHPSYNPEFSAYYNITAPSAGQEIQPPQSYALGEYLPTPTLKTVREVTFLDGSNRTAIQYLWHDKDYNFFTSQSVRGEKKFAFKFSMADFYGMEPHHFSMGFDKEGNILCVFRIEHLANNLTDSVRRNPILLVRSQGYKPKVIEFGDRLKPSGWLQNCGFLCTDDYIMLTEYTRPSVATANTWKANYPLDDAENWKTVQSFTLSPEVNPTDNMKHIHNVDRDPFTGYVYTSTGDANAGAAIYISKDQGETFQTVLSGSEKYARVLNWVFTKDYIYWATDSTGGNHWFFRATRNSAGEMDAALIEDVLQFPGDSAPTYATIYLPKIDALLFLGRHDASRVSVPIDLWDIKNSRFVRVGTLPSTANAPAPLGFRCESFEYIPRGNDVPCGFSRSLGPGGYANYIGILGNTQNANKKVNNIIITVERVGEDFTLCYDTVAL